MSDRPPTRRDGDPLFAIVVLAAGASTRLGRTKQLVELDGRPLVRHVIDAAAAVDPAQLVVVLGHDADAVAAAIGDAPCEIVHNPLAAEGQGTSLAAGIGALGPDISRAVILLGDEPHVDPAVIACVAFGAGLIRRARYRDRAGHPISFDRPMWGRLQSVSGDQGARSVLREFPDEIREVQVDADAPIDLDTEDDLRALSRRHQTPPPV
jgi:molybdenum cofactor cytidylyltransferase